MAGFVLSCMVGEGLPCLLAEILDEVWINYG